MTKKTDSGVGPPGAHITESIGPSYWLKSLVTGNIWLESYWLTFVIATNLPSHHDYAIVMLLLLLNCGHCN